MVGEQDKLAPGHADRRVGIAGYSLVLGQLLVRDPLIHQIAVPDEPPRADLRAAVRETHFKIPVGLPEKTVHQLDQILFLRIIKRDHHGNER